MEQDVDHSLISPLLQIEQTSLLFSGESRAFGIVKPGITKFLGSVGSSATSDSIQPIEM